MSVMPPAAREWFAEATVQDAPWTADSLVPAKRGRRVSVVLPALNEEETVGKIVDGLRPLVGGLIDELVVMDSGSSDRTAEVARDAGAQVLARDEVLPQLPPRPGKGEVLWRSLAATTGDILVFIDSDLIDFESSFVPSLLGPLLTRPGTQLVKGFYRRPLRGEVPEAATGGGRVTELLARPLLNALRPELAGVVQPLGGEYCATRRFLRSVPFAPGYGVEIGLLLDAHRRYGLSGLAQVNVGVRKHRNRTQLELGVMSREILGAALPRCGITEHGAPGITQFVQSGAAWSPTETGIELLDRPPMSEVEHG